MQNEPKQHLYLRSAISKDPGINDSLSKIAAQIPHQTTVLDVGCAVGSLGAYLTEFKDCVVDGIEGNPEAAAMARLLPRGSSIISRRR